MASSRIETIQVHEVKKTKPEFQAQVSIEDFVSLGIYIK